jgi:hypoxanthine phosphoribosyltransferase
VIGLNPYPKLLATPKVFDVTLLEVTHAPRVGGTALEVPRASSGGHSKVRVVLLGGLSQDVGSKILEVQANSWTEALLKLRERIEVFRRVIDENGKPQPGYLVFIDGVDSRLVEKKPAREIIILPVNHGGIDTLHLTWEDVERLSYRIAEEIKKDGRRVDVIIGIMRGGIVPARIIADVLGVDDLETMEIKFYKGIGIRGKRPYVKRPPLGELHDRSVLIVDDISDTGLTLETALNTVSLYGPKDLVTAALYVKPWTKFVPDYYAGETDKWVVFPWEKKEVLRELGGEGL